ncbi:MAG: starch synthase [Candidatus Wallbacteria bacterium HGW-Wallbacteria-1]|jgi:starch synthase|uniref:Glycogen synthase n=1 Tax=Candidatus Wallbacteria bacterium HGW-Wallbacteria-1 TaxID=2013854 RepID=A0A2N1PUC3_9BACT|nr:MAG: starch synthase [Candidatus Wallbacteria bacterium HGW-Wallbacteria-1]
MNQNLKVVFVTGECLPFAKTGGLADVSSALPRTIAAMGHQICIFLPRYRQINQNEHGLRYVGDFPVNMGGFNETAILKRTYLGPEKVPVYFIDNYRYFDRNSLYGYADDAERFIFFCKALPEALRFMGIRPDVIHCNDWFTGLIPPLIKGVYHSDPVLGGVSTVFSIHNLAYQGTAPKEYMDMLQLGWEHFHTNGVEFYDAINPMKAGIVYSDAISTVSPTYAREIQTPEFGVGLDGLLRSRANSLWGILNGVDYVEWNPAADPHLYGLGYDLENFHAKEEIKSRLLSDLHLLPGKEPLIGMVSRLVNQKGFDMLGAVIHKIMQLPVKLVVLGTGQPEYERMFTSCAEAYPGRISCNFTFNNTLSHRIEAASDMFLMPSRYEPCGLNQIYSLRYGTIPVVRSTGGLADTVVDFNSNQEYGNGFSFYDTHGDYLVDAVSRAVSCYYDPMTWMRIVANAMNSDFSWERSAGLYVEMYRSIL